jgi:hypothetical protein
VTWVLLVFISSTPEVAMQKIRLDVDELKVESFAVEKVSPLERGTVRAEENSGANCGTTRIGHCFCTEGCA